MPDTGVLPQLCCVPTLADRRAALRYHCDQDITCQPFPSGDDAQWKARVRDISTTGIGLLTDRPFEPEAFLTVQMLAEEPILSYTFLVKVVHARPHPDNEWLLGCLFARELSAAELHALL